MKYVYFFVFLLIPTPFIFSQELPIGGWRDELPYNQLIALAESNDFIYAATPYSVLSYHKNTAVFERISKVNGLSDFGVKTIAYTKNYNTLLIAYTNSNIDLIKDGKIINLSDIKRKSILGNKTIYNILFVNQFAYLSCGFGIVVVDILKEEIKDTYYLSNSGNSIKVYDLAILDNEFFVATENGIYRAGITNPNLANFANWTKLNHLPFPNDPYNHIEKFQNYLVANRLTNISNDQFFAVTKSNWIAMTCPINEKTQGLYVFDDKLYSVHPSAIGLFNTNFEFIRRLDSYGQSFSANPQLGAILKSANQKFYIADKLQGLVISSDLLNFTPNVLNGPRSTSVYDLSVYGTKAAIASGGRDESFGNVYMNDGVFSYSDGMWTNFYKTQTPALDTAIDFVCVDVNKNNTEEFAVGTWGKGVYTFNENGFDKAYGKHNSSLTPNSTYSHIMRIGGVAYDSKNNLWVASAVSNALLHKRDPSGKWTAFELGAWSAQDIKDIHIDKQDNIWILLRKGNTNLAFVFDEKQASGQQLKGLTNAAGKGRIPGTQLLSVAHDLDGEIWLGTDEGIGVIYQPQNIFGTGDYDAQKIIVERDGYAQYLLESEKVKAIAVDGANRKWVGTERAGVFLLSADGREEIHHFTAENSPLYSNNINAIGLNENGEVFIGTENGLLVYRGSSSVSNPSFSDVYAFPNPVRPDYKGAIAIRGLSRDAYVKITDISGRLVFEMLSEGGQAIWSGENMNGQRVNTGIYLVFIANTDGTESIVSKIMFIQ